MDPFIGQIILFAGNFAPRGWAFCDGHLLPIAQNPALFSILGTTYGGDGRTTFALPDLRGRAPIHAGTAPGLTPRTLGSRSGTETTTLSTSQLPGHSHGVACSSADGTISDPTGSIPALGKVPGADVELLNYVGAPTGQMSAAMIAPTGDGQAHDNMPPFLTLNYIIALVGVFPSRN